MWEFGEPDTTPETGGVNRMYLSCKLCGKHMSGGINILKFHLGQISGKNIELCTNTTPEIIRRAIQSLMDKEDGKDIIATLESQLVGALRVGGSESGSSASHYTPTCPNPSAFSSFFVPRTTAGSQPGIKSSMKKRKRQKLTS